MKALASALLALFAALTLPSPAAAQTLADDLSVRTPLVSQGEWAGLLPQIVLEDEPSAEELCASGEMRCIDAMAREMDRRFDRLARSCDHDAIFALSYLRATQRYRQTIEDPTYLHDTRGFNHEVAVFGSFYFNAYDAWQRGDHSRVPPAWRIAFEAADGKSVPAAANLLIGINAHVQRDLPFVIEATGLVNSDSSPRKQDFDAVNPILRQITEPLVAEIARRFDPTMDDRNAPGTVDEDLIFQIMVVWRERAWRNAELLASAPTPLARALVAQQIEMLAAEQARMLRGLSTYSFFSEGSAPRDLFCEENWRNEL